MSVAHFADHDDVRGFAESVFERGGEAVRVGDVEEAQDAAARRDGTEPHDLEALHVERLREVRLALHDRAEADGVGSRAVEVALREGRDVHRAPGAQDAVGVVVVRAPGALDPHRAFPRHGDADAVFVPHGVDRGRRGEEGRQDGDGARFVHAAHSTTPPPPQQPAFPAG